jgi:hypothetical protein
LNHMYVGYICEIHTLVLMTPSQTN